MEKTNSGWVAEQIASLNPPPEWQPNAAAALTRFHAPRRHHPRWTGWALAAAVAVAAIVLLPPARGLAQQIWQLLTVRRVAFIRVNSWPEGVPSLQVNIIGTPLPPIPARSLDEAHRRVHYEPRLPRAGVLSGSPNLYTTFGISAGTVVKAVDLALALRKTGVTDQSVPPEWDGAHLALHTSAVVLAQWPEAALAQSLPLTLSAPANFDFAAFSTLMLRILGVGPEEAKQLAAQMGTTPPWLAPLSKDFDRVATFEEITLKSGPATLAEQNGRITLAWSVPDRVYVLTGNVSRELAIATANAVE